MAGPDTFQKIILFSEHFKTQNPLKILTFQVESKDNLIYDNRLMKKIIFIFLLFIIIAPLQAQPLEKGPNIPVESYLVFNVETDTVIFEKNPNAPHAPASLAKLMTLYLTLDAIRNGKVKWDQLYTAPKHVCRVGGSKAKLWPGEKISIRDLYKAAAIGSANDAAAALAEIIGGSQTNFVNMMNIKARSLGLTQTRFVSPHGLPPRPNSPKDTTTAVDLKNLTLAILKNHPEMLQTTSLKETYIRKGKYRFNNTNKLIGKYAGMTGLKTGFTNAAGFCLVSTVKRGNLSVICVLLGAKSNKERFLHTQKLLNEVFLRFTNVSHFCKGKSFEIPIAESANRVDIGIAQRNLLFIGPKNAVSKIHYELFIPHQLKAPISQGQKIGEYVATWNGKVLARTNVLAQKPIEKKGLLKRIWS